MNYYVYVNGTTHKLVQGFTISEEYNETLDSASVVISDSPQLELEPYDDVFIFSEYCALVNDSGEIVPNFDKKFVFKGYPINNNSLYSPKEMPYFYKHFLLYKFVEKIIVLGENEEDTRYQYTIELFSETKGLETIPVDTMAITQPLKNKISTLDYINRLLNLYNKRIKVSSKTEKFTDWSVKLKYSKGNVNKFIYSGNKVIPPYLLSNIDDIFENTYAPDFSLTNPTLRQVLEKLFIIKDCIPIIYDDRLYALNISLTHDNFDLKKGRINYITGSLSSENYCTDLKRVYSDALPSQEQCTKFVEALSFRNRDSSLLTYSNMRLETTYPIYKINKIYMCYYKKVYVSDTKLSTSEIKTPIIFLCKQDITPFVKLNSERNLLSQDTDAFSKLESPTIDEFTSYKFGTVGYDIGSKYISGWGEQYSYLTGNFWWKNESRSILQNIFEYMEKNNFWGSGKYDETWLTRSDIDYQNYLLYYEQKDNATAIDTIIIPVTDYSSVTDSDFIKKLNIEVDALNTTLHLKHVFFEMDYQGFYSGVITQSKGLSKGDITVIDNQSSSLALLENEGLNQEAKIKRFGNKGIQINARYENVNDLQKLGSIYNHNKDKDIIIYNKQYSINDNVVNCSYSGTKNYVLKDYFTSVYAKYRTYNLMSYSESIERSTDKKIYFLMSKNQKYNDKYLSVGFNNIVNNKSKEQLLFSFYKATELDERDNTIFLNKIDYGYFTNPQTGSSIASDLNVFTSGNVLCFNIAMSDNITAGVNIEYMKNTLLQTNIFDTSSYVTGGLQKWINMTDENGNINNLTFTFAHNYNNKYDLWDASEDDIQNLFTKGLYKLPDLTQTISRNDFTNTISFTKNIYKDNKERLNMTFQIEPLADEDIYISPYFFKLNDLVCNDRKVTSPIETYETVDVWNDNDLWCSGKVYHKCIPITFNNATINYNALIIQEPELGSKNANSLYLNFNVEYAYQVSTPSNFKSTHVLVYLKFKGKNYKKVEVDKTLRYSKIIITCEVTVKFKLGDFISPKAVKTFDTDLVFTNYSNQQIDSYDWGDYASYYQKISEELSAKGFVGPHYICLLRNGWGDNTKNFLYTIGDLEQAQESTYNGDYLMALPLCYYNESCYNGDYVKVDNGISFYTQKGIEQKPTSYIEQNIYWVLLVEELHNYQTRNEYSSLDEVGKIIDVSIKFNDVNNAIITHNCESGNYIGCYYLHNGYYSFAFGFKCSDKEDTIKLSVLGDKDLTIYDKSSMLKVGSLDYTGYILIINQGKHVKSIVARTEDGNLIYSGAEIYNGKKIYITAEAEEGYELFGYTREYVAGEGDLVINVNAHEPLVVPSIEVTYTGQNLTNVDWDHRPIFEITNKNNTVVTCSTYYSYDNANWTSFSNGNVNGNGKVQVSPSTGRTKIYIKAVFSKEDYIAKENTYEFTPASNTLSVNTDIYGVDFAAKTNVLSLKLGNTTDFILFAKIELDDEVITENQAINQGINTYTIDNVNYRGSGNIKVTFYKNGYYDNEEEETFTTSYQTILDLISNTANINSSYDCTTKKFSFGSQNIATDSGQTIEATIYTKTTSGDWNKVDTITYGGLAEYEIEEISRTYTIDAFENVLGNEIKVALSATDYVTDKINVTLAQFKTSGVVIMSADHTYNTKNMTIFVSNTNDFSVTGNFVITNSNGKTEWEDLIIKSDSGVSYTNDVVYADSGTISLTISKLGYENETITYSYETTYSKISRSFKISNLEWLKPYSNMKNQFDVTCFNKYGFDLLGKLTADSDWVTISEEYPWSNDHDSSGYYKATVSFTNKVNDSYYRYIKLAITLGKYTYYSNELSTPVVSLEAPIIYETSYDYSTKKLSVKFRDNNDTLLKVYIYTKVSDNNWHEVTNFSHNAAETMTKTYTVAPDYVAGGKVKIIFKASQDYANDNEASSSITYALGAPKFEETLLLPTRKDSTFDEYNTTILANYNKILNYTITNNNYVDVKYTVTVKNSNESYKYTYTSTLSANQSLSLASNSDNIIKGNYTYMVEFTYGNVNKSLSGTFTLEEAPTTVIDSVDYENKSTGKLVAVIGLSDSAVAEGLNSDVYLIYGWEQQDTINHFLGRTYNINYTSNKIQTYTVQYDSTVDRQDPALTVVFLKNGYLPSYKYTTNIKTE